LCTVAAGTPRRVAIRAGPSLDRRRKLQIFRSTLARVRLVLQPQLF
jgi:hypothetical protein